MDRVIVYPGAIPLETDLLSAQRNAMVGIGYIAQAAVGSGVVDGLQCTPAVGSLGVNIAPGAVFALSPIDQNAFSSLPANANPVVKVGINTMVTAFTLTAPTTPGQSIAYLIEAAFLENPDTPLVLPYFNSANTSQPLSGPGGAGGAQNTRLTQRCSLQLKAGVAAPTGTQSLPAVDAGWLGLYQIVVNYGESAIIPGDITVLPGAPFVGAKLPALSASLAALRATVAALALKEGQDFAAINTALSEYEEAANAAIAAVRPGTSQQFIVDGVPGVKTFVAPWSGQFRIILTGGGGGGGGCTATQAGGGGGAGGSAEGFVALVAGQSYSYAVGDRGLYGPDDGSSGGAGGTSSFAGFLAASGGGGGQGGVTGGSAGGSPGIGVCQPGQTAYVAYGGWGSDGSPGACTYGGVGGASRWGGGARGATSDGTAEYGLAEGSGGGGAYGGVQHAGGAGAVGLVIVEG